MDVLKTAMGIIGRREAEVLLHPLEVRAEQLDVAGELILLPRHRDKRRSPLGRAAERALNCVYSGAMFGINPSSVYASDIS